MNTLKDIRQALGLSAKEVYSGICDRRTYAQIETNLLNGKMDILLKICGRLGLSYSELFHLTGVKNFEDDLFNQIKTDSHKWLKSGRTDILFDIVKELNELKFKNPQYLSLFIGLSTIVHKTSAQKNIFTPKLLNEIVLYYKNRKNKDFYANDYLAFSNLLPAIDLKTADQILPILIPYNKNTVPSPEMYTALLFTYGNYIDKCLNVNEIDKGIEILKHFKSMPKYYEQNFDYLIWLQILENLIIYKKMGHFKNFLFATELFKLIKHTNNKELLKIIEKQFLNIAEGNSIDKELLIVKENAEFEDN